MNNSVHFHNWIFNLPSLPLEKLKCQRIGNDNCRLTAIRQRSLDRRANNWSTLERSYTISGRFWVWIVFCFPSILVPESESELLFNNSWSTCISQCSGFSQFLHWTTINFIACRWFLPLQNMRNTSKWPLLEEVIASRTSWSSFGQTYCPSNRANHRRSDLWIPSVNNEIKNVINLKVKLTSLLPERVRERVQT